MSSGGVHRRAKPPKYQVRKFLSEVHASVYKSRNRALEALIEGIVVHHWPVGLRGASIIEYDDVQSEKIPVSRRNLKRRWFFRQLGTPLPVVYQMKERIGAQKDRRRFVLHVHNYKTSLTAPVYVGNELLLRGRVWMQRYLLAHWLLNASRCTLRRAAKRLGMSKYTQWLERRQNLCAKIFAEESISKDCAIGLQLPKIATVFAFEKRCLHDHVYQLRDFLQL